MDLVPIAISGILLGGLVNALADDLPSGRLPRRPRYANGKPRPCYAWLGISALLVGAMRPSPPLPRLGRRYALTELAVTGLMLATHVTTSADPSLAVGQRLIWQAQAVLFVLLAVVDIEHKLILLTPLLAAVALALVDAAVFPLPGPNMASAVVGGACAGAAFALIYLGGRVFARLAPGSDTAAFGLGDVLLMALGGFMLGFPGVLLAMTLAIALGGAGAALYLARRRLRGCRYRRYTALPYGPYILAAIVLVIITPSEIKRAVLGL